MPEEATLNCFNEELVPAVRSHLIFRVLFESGFIYLFFEFYFNVQNLATICVQLDEHN